MAKYQKRTAEEKARWRENHERLQRIIQRRLAEEARAREPGQADARETKTS